jgi:hypothetical protein
MMVRKAEKYGEVSSDDGEDHDEKNGNDEEKNKWKKQ